MLPKPPPGLDDVFLVGFIEALKRSLRTKQVDMDLKQRNEYDNDDNNNSQNMEEHGPGIRTQSRNKK